MEAHFEGFKSHPSLNGIFPDAPSIMTEVVTLMQKMIRNRCVNSGDRNCEEIINIRVLEEYLAGYGIRCQIHSRPGECISCEGVLIQRPNLSPSPQINPSVQI
jgi:hypothetical protein